MTPEEALALIEATERNAPDRIPAACNMVARESIRWAQQSLSRDKKIYAEVAEVKKVLMKTLAALRGVASTDSEQQQPEASNGAPPSRRMNADGSEMTPEEAALEDQMDAATAGMPPNASAPGPKVPFGTQPQPTVPTPTPTVQQPAPPSAPKQKNPQPNNNNAPKA